MSFVVLARFCQPRFDTGRGSWAAREGLKGLICIYAPNEYSNRLVFVESIISFVHN